MSTFELDFDTSIDCMFVSSLDELGRPQGMSWFLQGVTAETMCLVKICNVFRPQNKFYFYDLIVVDCSDHTNFRIMFSCEFLKQTLSKPFLANSCLNVQCIKSRPYGCLILSWYFSINTWWSSKFSSCLQCSLVCFSCTETSASQSHPSFSWFNVITTMIGY